MQVHIIEALWRDHIETLRSIRKTVFIIEQKVPQELEWDGQDEESHHFLAINEMGQYIGCARLLPTGQIGRMAVLKAHRGKEIGLQLLEATVAKAQSLSMSRVHLHAQSYAETFYRKGGFVPYGLPFQEAGIAHIAMEQMLAIPFSSSTDKVNDTGIESQAVAPKQKTTKHNSQPMAPMSTSGPTNFDTETDCLEQLLDTIRNTRRRLDIFSPFLDHQLFDLPDVVSAISQLARSAPRVEIRILIMSSKLIVDRGHRLHDLARRLDSKISIRLLDEKTTEETSTYLCGDFDCYWLLPNFNKYEGIADQANPVMTKRLADVFLTAWERSEQDPQLRVLRI